MSAGVFGSGEFHEVGFDELVDFPVHHPSDVRRLVVRSVVFYAAVVEDVGAYLGAPLDLLLARLDFCLCGLPALQFPVVEIGA